MSFNYSEIVCTQAFAHAMDQINEVSLERALDSENPVQRVADLVWEMCPSHELQSIGVCTQEDINQLAECIVEEGF